MHVQKLHRVVKFAGFCLGVAGLFPLSPYGQPTVWESIGDPGGNGGATFTSIHPATGHI